MSRNIIIAIVELDSIGTILSNPIYAYLKMVWTYSIKKEKKLTENQKMIEFESQDEGPSFQKQFFFKNKIVQLRDESENVSLESIFPD